MAAPLVGVALCAGFLGACTQSSGGDPGPGADAAAGSASPLAAYIKGWNPFGPPSLTEAQQAEANAKQQQYQQAIADCMAEQGFTYVPLIPPADEAAVMAEVALEGTLQYAQKYGFGNVDNPWSKLRIDPSANPNTAYIAGLSVEARYAYNVALKGRASAEIEKQLDEGQTKGPQGLGTETGTDSGNGADCTARASSQIYSAGGHDEYAFTELISAAKLALAQIDSDPRVVEAVQGWSDCMVDAGYPRYGSRLDVRNEYSEQFGRVVRSDGSAVEAFRAEEIEAAVSDATCADSTGYTRTLADVQYEIERGFVADHEAELDAYVAEYGTP